MCEKLKLTIQVLQILPLLSGILHKCLYVYPLD